MCKTEINILKLPDGCVFDMMHHSHPKMFMWETDIHLINSPLSDYMHNHLEEPQVQLTSQL